jgi:hypothetical protein
LGRDLVPERHTLKGADEPVEVECRDHVSISIAHQARQDLAITREVAEVSDGFSDQGGRGPS